MKSQIPLSVTFNFKKNIFCHRILAFEFLVLFAYIKYYIRWRVTDAIKFVAKTVNSTIKTFVFVRNFTSQYTIAFHKDRCHCS